MKAANLAVAVRLGVWSGSLFVLGLASGIGEQRHQFKCKKAFEPMQSPPLLSAGQMR